jgi:hypothetical protein
VGRIYEPWYEWHEEQKKIAMREEKYTKNTPKQLKGRLSDSSLTPNQDSKFKGKARGNGKLND